MKPCSSPYFSAAALHAETCTSVSEHVSEVRFGTQPFRNLSVGLGSERGLNHIADGSANGSGSILVLKTSSSIKLMISPLCSPL